MKNILRLSLATVAISALAACGGGGGTSDAADVYVGTWKSVCFSYVANNGSTYYTRRIRTLTKSTATELASNTVYDNAYADSACKQSLGAITSTFTPDKYNIGAKTTFLGAPVDSIVATDVATGSTSLGYMTADSTQLLIVTFTAGQPPAGWGLYSPYTKQ